MNPSIKLGLFFLSLFLLWSLRSEAQWGCEELFINEEIFYYETYDPYFMSQRDREDPNHLPEDPRRRDQERRKEWEDHRLPLHIPVPDPRWRSPKEERDRDNESPSFEINRTPYEDRDYEVNRPSMDIGGENEIPW